MAADVSLAIANATGLRLDVDGTGRFEIAAQRPHWIFGGDVGAPLADLASRQGEDGAGAFGEISFSFRSPKGAARRGAMRLYERRSVALFEIEFVEPGDVTETFPALSRYPRELHHLSYASVFGGYSFKRLGADGPWVFFDDACNAFIFSAASNFMNASLRIAPDQALRSGLASSARHIPAGFTHASVLAVAPGVNRAFDVWGRFLTDRTGKRRPANDADVGLRTLGYWTDRGASYYYRCAPWKTYATTLLAVRDEFNAAGVALGYMQLDSWFYPKGREGRWRSADRLGGGVSRYEAAPHLFPDGLSAFQKQLGLPLITHNRWIDASSPYRQTYAISGNVSVDPALWAEWMVYLRASGVCVYEQDWLVGPAAPDRDLDSGERFMDLMAQSADKAGLALQYCMPLPRHFLQSARYGNVTTIRTSADRFSKKRWKPFLFNGRLATALGAWPWSDVFLSRETSNLLVATLSGGMVGVGDALGDIDRDNLMRAIRADGVIVKPDDPLTPLDSSFVAQAKDARAPVVACARTDHDGWIASYMFAFSAARRSARARIGAETLGYDGPVYAYDYFNARGLALKSGEERDLAVPARGAYWIVVPMTRSGVAFLGDHDKFVSAGRNRIAGVAEDGRALRIRLALAAGERLLRLHGFSRTPVSAQARGAAIERMTHDAASGVFQFEVLADDDAAPEILLQSLAD